MIAFSNRKFHCGPHNSLGEQNDYSIFDFPGDDDSIANP
jgi:hypothetical protein